MKISVIVPVYNVEKYLSQCLTSILNQTYTDLEIIIINDGSTDFSPNICEQFATKDERIRLINQRNGGVSVARNAGIKEATGEFITFVDSDDWLEPTMYEKMFAVINEYPDLEMVMCDATLITNHSKIKSTEIIRSGYYLKSEIVSELYPVLLVTEEFGKIPLISVWNCLIKRRVLNDHRIFFDATLHYGEDYLFMPEVVIHIGSFYYLKEQNLYNYRQYEQSRSKKLQPEWWRNFLYLNNKLRNLLANSKEFNFERQLKLQMLHSALFLTSAIQNYDKLSKKAKLKIFRKLFSDLELLQAFSNLSFYKQSFPL